MNITVDVNNVAIDDGGGVTKLVVVISGDVTWFIG